MKRITSFLLAILMLVSLIPADLAYAMEAREEKLDIVPLNDGQYMIKLSGVDYTIPRQGFDKPDINPDDNPREFSSRTITVDISEIVIDALEYKAEKIEDVTVTVTCALANYSKEYTLKRNAFGENGGIKVPIPKAKYIPQILVKFNIDGRDSRYLVEAKNKPKNVVNITMDLLAHTGVATRWHGDSERPEVEANYLGLNRSPHKFSLPKVDQNTVLRSPSNTFQWRGHDNIVLLPVVPEADIEANTMDTVKKMHLEIQDALQGQLADSKYYFQITGESYSHRGFTATMREKNTVDFEAGKGAWKTAKPAQQFAANGLKLSETFMEAPDTIGPVTIPNGENDLTPPKAEAGKPENVFKGWATTENGPVVDMNTFVVTGDTTFHAIYGPKDQGKIKVEYKDSKTNAAIDPKYQLKGQEYPAEKPGNKDEAIKDEVFDTEKAPKFLGYKIKSITTDPVPNPPATANYTKDGDYTVIYTYDKLDDIIPEKKNGQDNPDVTPDVKEHYAKVTFQVAAADDEKAKLQLGGTDATSPLVYYVNPLEGKTIAQVADVNAVSKDTNLYNVDANDMWTYNPDTITNTNQVISQATDSEGNIVKTEITLTAKVADKTAVKFKDKLDPQDIKVWLGDTIDWKKGVKVKDDAENKDQLVADLKTELAKAKAKVEDLGENGTIAEPKTARTSEKQNLPDGKKGNLKVTFDDGSTLVVNEQKLYVSPLKVPVKPGEENQVDPDKLPKDKLAVEFKLGEGVKIGNKEGTTTPVLYETYYVKPNTSLESGDIPTTEVLNNNYKNNNWYNGNNVLAKADYTNITTDKTFVAKATPKGQGSAVVEYHVGNENITTKIADFKIDGQNYPANNKLTGAEDSVIDTSNITQPDLIGYKKVNITTEPATDAKYTEAGTAKVIFNYEKLDDIIGPVKPGDQKPAGYVTVAFKATTGSVLDPGETSYFVNPKADKKAKVSKVGDNYQISGKKADGTDLTGNVPVVNSTDKNKFEIQYADGEAKKWGYDNFNKVGQDLTTDTTFTAQVIKLGEPTVTFPPVEIEKGGSKEVTPEVKDKHGNKVDKPGKPEITKTPDGITVTPNNDGTVKIEVPKDYNGPGEITIKVKYKIGDKEVPGEINVKVKDDKKPEPKPEPQPVPEVEIPGIKIRDHYTPTYPVYVSVPDNGTKVIDTLWYIFHIDKYDYEEVRNNNSTSHKMDVTPVIRNERTMLPLRYVAEAIGADVKWDPETRTATFTKDGLIATIQIDSDEIVLSNGKTVKMDSKPLNINDRILVSVVNVGNVFGLTNGNTLDGVDQDIEWDHDTRTATIYIRR